MYVLYFVKLRERRLFGRGRQEWYKVRLPQIARSFNEIEKVPPFVKFE